MPVIKVYSTTVCPYCVSVKQFLSDNGFEYEEVNVGLDTEARQEMVALTGQMGVPVIKIDDEVIVGFNREKISQILKI